ncbi:hypothetical protein [Candidatus Uabimicrobium sp. HlEnr_7]|uniref:hypothetical protein n=1 Tax=Candidatus Uabimicrobium helgolandensis TaxID=3095367 RepID=UPI003555D670
MRLSDYIVDHLHFKATPELQLSMYLPDESQGLREEVCVLEPRENKKNILFISNARKCKIYKANDYNLVCINYQLRDQLFDILEKDAKVEKKQIMNSFVQSNNNLMLILLIDEDMSYVDAISITRFLRKSLNNNVPIRIYVLLPVINDLLYSRLLFLNCHCSTPFAMQTIYGEFGPNEANRFLHSVDEIYKTLPKKQNADTTQIMSVETYQEYNFDGYDIETVYDLTSHKSYDEQMENLSTINTSVYNSITVRPQQSIPINLDIFSDIDLHLTLSVLWKGFSKIVHYMNSVLGKKLRMKSIYSSSLDYLSKETQLSPSYRHFYQSIEKSLEEIFSDPLQPPHYSIDIKNQEQLAKNIFNYYHLFCRLIGIIVYNMNSQLEREDKVKIAVKIIEILKKDIGLFPIPMCIDSKWQELTILDVFKYFRKNKL